MGKKNLLIIHGIAAKRISYDKLISFMNDQFHCHYFPYETTNTIPEIVQNLKGYIQNIKPLDVVTVSFGAVIIRNAVKQLGNEIAKKIVMIGPTNQGSRLLKAIMRRTVGKRMFGNLALDFISHEQKYLPEIPEHNIGIIAGTKPVTSHSNAVNRYIARLFDTEYSDGKVKVEETKLPYMKDYLEIDEMHEHLIENDKCLKYAKHFLLHGRFTNNNNQFNPL